MKRALTAAVLLLAATVSALAQVTPLGPRFVLPYQTVVDTTGVVVPGALLNFYASGTSTRLTTYSDPLLTTPNANPVQANAAGVFPNIFLNGNYKVVLTDSSGNQIWTADPVFGAQGSVPISCIPSGSQYQILIIGSGGATCVADASTSANLGALTLGASGTVGSVTMGNATSGTVKLQPVTGALGTVTASLPANTGTLAELNYAQSWPGAQRGTPTNIAISTATFTPNFNTAQNFEIDLIHASCPCTLANPSTTLVAGQSGVIEIHQSATGSDSIGTWGSDYQYVGGTASITLSTGANAVDYLPYYVNNAATGIVLGGLLLKPVH